MKIGRVKKKRQKGFRSTTSPSRLNRAHWRAKTPTGDNFPEFDIEEYERENKDDRPEFPGSDL